MAAPTQGLNVVARLKAEAEGKAGEALRAAQRRLADEEARLEAVRALVEEYRGRGHFVGGQLKQLRDTRDFIAQLQEGLEAQVAAVERQRRTLEAARAQWVSARMQREAIDRLVDERSTAEDRRRERSEQRQIDDRVRPTEGDAFTGTGG